MLNLQTILDASSLSGISVTTSVRISVLGTSYPPSLSVFSDESKEAMSGILGFLARQVNSLLVNLYPYFAYASDPQNIRLNYARFSSTNIVVQDGSLGYSNMLDAMIDSFFGQWRRWLLLMWTLLCLRVVGLLMEHQRGSMLFAMFNENLKPTGVEQHFGLFYPNMRPVYPVFPVPH
ncbi:hypothetical protein K1719_016624 [Acacia pycnantha]|nr:hypothetical protein K1719_016624 [Acacia pycnantha]